MLKAEIEMVKALARIIAKEEVAAMAKPEIPAKEIEALARKIVKEETETFEKNVVLMIRKVAKEEIANAQPSKPVDASKKGGK